MTNIVCDFLKRQYWLTITIVLFIIASILIIISSTIVSIVILRTKTTTSTSVTTTTTTAPFVCFTIPSPRPSNQWFIVGNMSIPRQYHTSTYLSQDNSVLIASGYYGIELKTTEKYNQSTGCFQNGLDMPRTRRSHTADILPAFPDYIFFSGGVSSSGILNVTDLFNPITGSTITLPLTTIRYAHGSTVLSSSQLVLIGGMDSIGHIKTGDAIISGSTTTFIASRNTMNVSRSDHTVTRLGNNSGIILITGGRDGSAYYSSSELYYGASNIFISLGSGGMMTTARAYHTATYLPNFNKVLITGGHYDGWTNLNTMILFDIATYSFTTLTSTMSTYRSWHTATLLPNGKVLIVGGHNNTIATTSCDLIDPSNNYLTILIAKLSIGRYQHTTTLIPNNENENSTVLICGGLSAPSVVLNSCEIYLI
ncbi:hypothetical protein I4U23_027682 [Adineta vaga]|nr:hypothetical protein I4U23_027682 [Adineta vaga]